MKQLNKSSMADIVELASGQRITRFELNEIERLRYAIKETKSIYLKRNRKWYLST